MGDFDNPKKFIDDLEHPKAALDDFEHSEHEDDDLAVLSVWSIRKIISRLWRITVTNLSILRMIWTILSLQSMRKIILQF